MTKDNLFLLNHAMPMCNMLCYVMLYYGMVRYGSTHLISEQDKARKVKAMSNTRLVHDLLITMTNLISHAYHVKEPWESKTTLTG